VRNISPQLVFDNRTADYAVRPIFKEAKTDKTNRSRQAKKYKIKRERKKEKSIYGIRTEQTD
jgi:hypothetical protein